jgi:DNA-binding HxlR family transcriptional regulator
MQKKLAKSFRCATELTLEVLGGKWKTVILCFLKQRPCRYAELRKLIPDLSDKVLSERLAGLIETGLVVKKPLAGKSALYALTPRAKSLHSILSDLYAWGKAHAADYDAIVEDPLQQLDAGLL